MVLEFIELWSNMSFVTWRLLGFIVALLMIFVIWDSLKLLRPMNLARPAFTWFSISCMNNSHIVIPLFIFKLEWINIFSIYLPNRNVVSFVIQRCGSIGVFDYAKRRVNQIHIHVIQTQFFQRQFQTFFYRWCSIIGVR